MSDPQAIRLHCAPSIDQWRVVPRNGRATPVIATGHQPALWHPGILAKDIAADVFAQHTGGKALHVLVEHNPIQTRLLEVPHQHGRALTVRRCQLTRDTGRDVLPPNVAAPIPVCVVVDRLNEEASSAKASGLSCIYAGLGNLARAFAEVGDAHKNHAQQMGGVLNQLKRRYVSTPMHTRTTSQVVTPVFLNRLLADPVGCSRCYNRAVYAYPQARIRPLYIGRDVIEVPLWAQDEAACTPVYADLGQSGRPQLFTVLHNRHLNFNMRDACRYLRPRAMSLSAIMRSEVCDLFIHGTGGGVYDQATERWWHDWTGQSLAPMAVVSADVCLPFDVPVGGAEQYRRAVWFEHHLGFNIDRFEPARDEHEAALHDEKQALLNQMNADRDKRRRAKAFKRIHAINDVFKRQHHDRIRQAKSDTRQAKRDAANHEIAQKRDWCFVMYPDFSLRRLATQIKGLV